MVPAVTEVVSTPSGAVQFEDLTIDVIRPRDHGHSEDSSIYYLASEKTAHYTDVVEPGDLPHLYFNLGKDMAPKYGQYGDFEYVLEGHVYRMVSDVILHGLGHLRRRSSLASPAHQDPLRQGHNHQPKGMHCKSADDLCMRSDPPLSYWKNGQTLDSSTAYDISSEYH